MSKAVPTQVRYLVLAALCLVTAINYVQRNSIGGVETQLRDDLHLSKGDTGDAMSAFFLAYALAQIPSGWLAQRVGPRLALTLYTIGWSLTTAALGLVHGRYDLIGTRLLMGLLQAGIFPCATLIMAAWLPPTQRAFASGLLNSFMLIGAALVSNLTGMLLAPFGWRALFALYAVPGLVFAVGFYLWFRDRPADHPGVNDAERAIIGPGSGPTPGDRGPIPWLAIFLSASLLLICAQQFFRAGANRFFDQWLSTYLQENPLKGIEDVDERRATANQLTSLPQYAGVVGGLIGGWLSDTVLRRTGSRRLGRKGVAVASLAGAVVCYVAAALASAAGWQVFLFSLGSFVGSFAAPCAYAITMDVGGRYLAVVFGTMNMAGNFGAAALTWAVPRLIAKSEAGENWGPVLVMFVGIHVAALAAWLLLDADRPVAKPQAA